VDKIVGIAMNGLAQHGAFRSMDPDGFTVNWDYNDGNGPRRRETVRPLASSACIRPNISGGDLV